MANSSSGQLHSDGARHGLTWTDSADGTQSRWRHLHDQPLFADRSGSAPVAAVAGRGSAEDEDMPRPATAATTTHPSRLARRHDCPTLSRNHRNSERYLVRADK